MLTLAKRRLAVLGGTLDSDHELSKFHGNGLVWTKIFRDVDDDEFEKFLDRTSVAYLVRPGLSWRDDFYNTPYQFGEAHFPEPTGINVNMMPFRLGDLFFDGGKNVPDFLKGYVKLVRQCPVPVHTPNGWWRVVYLSVHESFVERGQSQRRHGLHIERPGSKTGTCRVVPFSKEYASEYRDIAWGLGYADRNGHPVDGIFMASTVSDSCAVYPCLIERPGEVTDAHGSIEHMRRALERAGVQPAKLKANQLCWITDRTPHESLPLETGQYRQWFRLVVGPISTWFSKHCTPNPLGVQPDAPISDEDKFA